MSNCSIGQGCDSVLTQSMLTLRYGIEAHNGILAAELMNQCGSGLFLELPVVAMDGRA